MDNSSLKNRLELVMAAVAARGCATVVIGSLDDDIKIIDELHPWQREVMNTIYGVPKSVPLDRLKNRKKFQRALREDLTNER